MDEKQQFLPLLCIVPDSAQGHPRSDKVSLRIVGILGKSKEERRPLLLVCGPRSFKQTLVPSVVDVCVG